MILTLTSPVDSNVPTRSALVLETKTYEERKLIKSAEINAALN